MRAEQVRKGTHITAVGSDDRGKRELDPAVLAMADILVADSVSQCVDHGECRTAVDAGFIGRASIRELGSVIANPELGRRDDDRITIADLTGVAVQGIFAANAVLLDKDSHAIVVTPNYQSHETLPVSICAATGVALDPDDDCSLDIDRVADSIRPNTTRGWRRSTRTWPADRSSRDTWAVQIVLNPDRSIGVAVA